jgi:hypothetical protein
MRVERFSMEKLPFWYPSRAFKRRLVSTGRSLRSVVNGDEIAGQFLLAGHSLIVTNYDYFDGVSTWFYLVDPTGKVIDNVSTPDYFGFIQDVKVQGPSGINFGFYGTNDRWELLVHESGFWSFKLAALARRINRFFWRKRYISLKCVKNPFAASSSVDNRSLTYPR